MFTVREPLHTNTPKKASPAVRGGIWGALARADVSSLSRRESAHRPSEKAPFSLLITIKSSPRRAKLLCTDLLGCPFPALRIVLLDNTASDLSCKTVTAVGSLHRSSEKRGQATNKATDKRARDRLWVRKVRRSPQNTGQVPRTEHAHLPHNSSTATRPIRTPRIPLRRTLEPHNRLPRSVTAPRASPQLHNCHRYHLPGC